MCSSDPEHGSTEDRAGSNEAQRRGGTLQPVFTHALMAGLILRHYRIHLLHLHPASITILSTFAYLCEAFLGVEPSVAFFRLFYSLRLSSPDITGCISFRLEPKVSGDLISMAVTRRLEDFRSD